MTTRLMVVRPICSLHWIDRSLQEEQQDLGQSATEQCQNTFSGIKGEVKRKVEPVCVEVEGTSARSCGGGSLHQNVNICMRVPVFWLV